MAARNKLEIFCSQDYARRHIIIFNTLNTMLQPSYSALTLADVWMSSIASVCLVEILQDEFAVCSAKLTNFLHHHSHAVKLLLDSSPVDHSRLHNVIQLEDNQTIRKVAVEMMYKRRDAQTVHPVAIHCSMSTHAGHVNTRFLHPLLTTEELDQVFTGRPTHNVKHSPQPGNSYLQASKLPAILKITRRPQNYLQTLSSVDLATDY